MTQMECNISTFTKTELEIKGTSPTNYKGGGGGHRLLKYNTFR